jgi:hypothetical protein
MLPDPAKQPTLSIPEGGALLGLKPRASFDAAKQYRESGGAHGLPVIEIREHRWRVPTATLLARLGLPRDEGPAADADPSHNIFTTDPSHKDRRNDQCTDSA